MFKSRKAYWYMLFVILGMLSNKIFAGEVSLQKTISMIEKTLMTDNAVSDINMLVVRGARQNKYSMTLWSKSHNFVTRTEKPYSQKGQLFLYNAGNCWIYYPAIDKTIKSSQNQRLLGGDFSFVDMASLDLSKKYTSEFIEYSNIGTNKYYEGLDPNLVDLMKNANIIESKLVHSQKGSYPMVRTFVLDNRLVMMQFFTLSGQLIGLIHYSDYQRSGSTWKPTTWKMWTTLNSKNYTILKFKKINYSRFIPEIYFTENYLKKLSKGR